MTLASHLLTGAKYGLFTGVVTSVTLAGTSNSL